MKDLETSFPNVTEKEVRTLGTGCAYEPVGNMRFFETVILIVFTARSTISGFLLCGGTNLFSYFLTSDERLGSAT